MIDALALDANGWRDND
jgi:hypothetical protein